MSDYEITIEETDDQVILTINDRPDEGHDDFFVMSWVIIKLIKAFVIVHPDRVSQLKKIVELTLKVDKELIN